MCEIDELPDVDYTSIYGHEALRERQRMQARAQLRCLDALLVRHAETLARLDALCKKTDPRKASL